MRAEAGGGPQRIMVIGTLGAPERRRLRGRRGAVVEQAGPEPVPTSRVTVIEPEPLADREAGAAWLAERRSNDDLAAAEVDGAVAVVNRALHAHRAARADPQARDVSPEAALVVRLGYGSGEAVAEGRFAEAWELPREGRRTRRSMEAPEERFAALLGGREAVLVCEDLVLRARADMDAGRPRAAALQARVALESVLAEIADMPAERRAALEADRGPVGDAANAALRGELSAEQLEQLAAAVDRMESALRSRRLGSAF